VARYVMGSIDDFVSFSFAKSLTCSSLFLSFKRNNWMRFSKTTIC